MGFVLTTLLGIVGAFVATYSGKHSVGNTRERVLEWDASTKTCNM